MEKCTKAAVYLKNGRPYSYTLFREGEPVTAGPVCGIYPEIVDFRQAYGMFTSIRNNYRPDGTPLD